ncbi:MAG: ORF6N domain-containing protein [Dysgonamonadaceae bacterium]|jgi:hypothetical protein|nr:ORF6N domain-containing protein [Dysgonamonadaceae bacterium]
MELQLIQNKICEVRSQKVMLDFDLAQLYEVENRALKQAVKRNINRFPPDFMFVMTEKEVDDMVSQFVIPSKSYLGGALPFAFTEQGVAMLSSILRSQKAIDVNIAIMRVFILIRQYTLSHKDLTTKIKELADKYDKRFEDVDEVINYLLQKDKQEIEQRERRRIGFNVN